MRKTIDTIPTTIEDLHEKLIFNFSVYMEDQREYGHNPYCAGVLVQLDRTIKDLVAIMNAKDEREHYGMTDAPLTYELRNIYGAVISSFANRALAHFMARQATEDEFTTIYVWEMPSDVCIAAYEYGKAL